MARSQKDAEKANKALVRLVDMLASRENLLKFKTTSFDLSELDRQIQLASDIAASNIAYVYDQRNLEYDELTKWTRMLSEARARLYEMEAKSLVKALEHVEYGLKVLFDRCWFSAGARK